MYIKRTTMLINNIRDDINSRCIRKKISQAELAKKAKTSPSYLNRLMKYQDKIVNQYFTRAMEILGYDIEIRYVRRKRGDGV